MTDREREAIKARRIRKANSLIQQSRNRLSLQQQKVVLFLISQIKQGDDDFKVYEFSIQEFCELTEINSSGKNYADLKNAILGIVKNPVGWVELEDGKQTILSWIEKPIINPGDGTIQLRLDKDMRPFLLNLKERYTTYEFGIPLKFKSKYSVILYEICSSYLYGQEYVKVFSIDELRSLLDADRYTAYCDFKKRVLSVSISEINKKSDKIIIMKENKKGRAGKVDKIILSISEKSGESLSAARQAAGLPAPRQPKDKPENQKRRYTRVPPAQRPENQVMHGSDVQADKVGTMRKLYSRLQENSRTEATT